VPAVAELGAILADAQLAAMLPAMQLAAMLPAAAGPIRWRSSPATSAPRPPAARG
jgi:ABC-type enterobactin transport system permease subunit